MSENENRNNSNAAAEDEKSYGTRSEEENADAPLENREQSDVIGDDPLAHSTDPTMQPVIDSES
ncbi:MAG: hypothetical protein Q8K36_03715, partial [Alphaproteobacteria bacterium]|nr:hypothetical protein [Alphaproteobacteria bacterium]